MSPWRSQGGAFGPYWWRSGHNGFGMLLVAEVHRLRSGRGRLVVIAAGLRRPRTTVIRTYRSVRGAKWAATHLLRMAEGHREIAESA